MRAGKRTTGYALKRTLIGALLALALTLPTLLSASAVFYPEKSCELFILLYHDLVDEERAKSNPLYTTTEEKMEEDLHLLLDAGYRPISLADYANGSYEAGGRYFCITFDDGYLSNYEIAFPLLKRMGIPGDIFAVTDRLGLSNHFKFFQADEMEEDGAVRIYSHSSLHADLKDLTDDELRTDVQRSFEMLETRLERADRHRLIAYPGGAYDEQSIAILRECGAVMQFVQNTPAWAPTDLIKRYMVYYDSDIEAMLAEYEADQRQTLHPLLPASRKQDRMRILGE